MLSKTLKSKNFWKYGGPIDIEFVIKITERCNLACDYCYFFFGGDESYKEHPAVFPKANANALVSFLEQASKELNLGKVSIILHGGEPMLAPVRRVRDLCDSIVSAIGDSCNLDFGIQTNATLVNDDWIKLFSDFKFDIGVSLDGPKDVNDQHRVDHNGNGSYDKVIEGLNQLKQAHSEGLISGVALIHVINKDVDTKRVYNHLVKELGFHYSQFLLPDKHHGNFDPNDAEGYKESLLNLYEAWACDETDNRIRFFSSRIEKLKTSAFVKNNIMQTVTSRRLVLSIGSDGNIGPDDSIRSASPDFIAMGLNIKKDTLLDVLLCEHLHVILERNHRPPKNCAGCDFENVCRGGTELITTFDPTLEANPFDGKSVYCEAYYALHEQMISDVLKAGMPESTVEDALGV